MGRAPSPDPCQPPGAVSHVGGAPVHADEWPVVTSVDVLAEVGQHQQMANFLMSDRFDNAPGHNVAREVINLSLRDNLPSQLAGGAREGTTSFAADDARRPKLLRGVRKYHR
jgi:hypothetical protein